MKRHTRHNFRGVLTAGKLTTRGCTVEVVDDEGNEISRAYDKRKSLLANIGDRLVVSSADLDRDEVASCRVETVYPGGCPGVVVVLGRVSDGQVFVMPSERAKVAGSKSKTRRVINATGEST